MKNKTIIFYDFEATSVARDADPISIGLVAVTKGIPCVTTDGCACLGWCKDTVKTFYAEFQDFDINKCDDWVKENVIGKLKYKQNEQKSSWFMEDSKINHYFGYGNINQVSLQLKQWLSQFESIEFWADFDVIDKPMLINLIADWDSTTIYMSDESYPSYPLESKIGLPKHLPNIRYDQFFDLHTLFKFKGIDTDINREEFAFSDGQGMSYHIDQINRLGLAATKHTTIWAAYLSYLCYEKLMV